MLLHLPFLFLFPSVSFFLFFSSSFFFIYSFSLSYFFFDLFFHEFTFFFLSVIFFTIFPTNLTFFLFESSQGKAYINREQMKVDDWTTIFFLERYARRIIFFLFYPAGYNQAWRCQKFPTKDAKCWVGRDLESNKEGGSDIADYEILIHLFVKLYDRHTHKSGCVVEL